LKAGFYKGDGIPGFKLSLSGSVTMESTGYRISLKMTSVPGEGQTDPDIVDSN
jgi:hypothetical protein